MEKFCIFPEESIGSFGSGTFGDFVVGSFGSRSLEDSVRKDLSYDFLGNQYVKFGEESWDEESEWVLGELMIVKEVSGSSKIESGKELGIGMVLDTERF